MRQSVLVANTAWAASILGKKTMPLALTQVFDS